MILDFPVERRCYDFMTNYELFMLPNGVYRAKSVEADNYLYPMYYFMDGDDYIISTSVYGLIHYKKRFIRNPRFQATRFYRPTFLTIDQEIRRVRTTYRRSTLELTDKDSIVKLGARLIQDYITQIENRFPGWVHILLMGGRDSENIILAKRTERWVILSGEPNALSNKEFIKDNGIKIERFIALSNETDNTFLLEEVMASDCMYDIAHFRWVRQIYDLVKEYDKKALIWIGTDGDGIFKRNINHRDKDYYAVHDLHLGTAMGVWHQMLKNLLNILVISPYQSPTFLNELFYRFDPYFVDSAGDVRPEIGEILFGEKVKYPLKNPTPAPWRRNRAISIPTYIKQLKRDGIPCSTNAMRSWFIGSKEKVWYFIDKNSAKRRSRLSRILYPLRRKLSKFIPSLRIKRYDITSVEIR